MQQVAAVQPLLMGWQRRRPALRKVAARVRSAARLPTDLLQ